MSPEDDDISAEELVREIARLRRKLRSMREPQGGLRPSDDIRGRGRRRQEEDVATGAGAGADAGRAGTRTPVPSRLGARRVGGGGGADGDATPPPSFPLVFREDVAARASDGGDPVGTVVLLEAELVPDPVEATPVRRGTQVRAAAGWALLGSAGAALVVGLAMGLVLLLGRRQSGQAPAGTDDGPGLVPVASLREAFYGSLPRSTLEAIRRAGTPQAEADRWLFGEGGDDEGNHPPLPAPEAEARIATRFALAALYHASRGGRSRIKEGGGGGWLDRFRHECLWEGVGCGGNGNGGAANAEIAAGRCTASRGAPLHTASCLLGSNGSSSRIDSVDLSGTGLEGTLPEEISLLKMAGIVSLRLDGNGLAGSMPSGVGELATLQHLILSENKLDGSIPSSLGRLSNLKTLRLSRNGLSGPIPAAITNLTGLVHLDVSRNRLAGSLPAGLGRMRALEVLDASDNRLGGSIPPEISQLTNMVRLELSGNAFQGAILPHVLPLRSLRALDIGYDMLTGTVPPSLSCLGNLTSLTLSSPSWLSGSVPRELGALEDVAFARRLPMRHQIVWDGDGGGP